MIEILEWQMRLRARIYSEKILFPRNDELASLE
jgi:hypothetical protein